MDDLEKRRVALRVINTYPEEWMKAKPEDFTCFTCAHWKSCDFAWDPYNTNGDCLESK